VTILLFEPSSKGRASGGFLYNQRVTAHTRAVRRIPVPDGALASVLATQAPGSNDVALLDSLVLSRGPVSSLVELRARTGAAVGALIHAFPSFIQRATDRATLARSLPLVPSDDEIALLSELDLVVTPGSNVVRTLAAAGCPTPGVACRPGVDRALRQGAPPDESGVSTNRGPPRLVAIGHTGPAKGFADALHALSRLSHHAVELALIGDVDEHPKHTAELRASTRALELSDRVRFLGALPHDRAMGELGASQLLLLASYSENCPLVVLEALARGVPVVGYAVGEMPNLIRDGHSGLLVPELDIEALTAALARVLDDRSALARLSRGAEEAGSRLPSWEEAARAFEESVTRLAAAPRR
jgi:glycosyltransferase involved in cell wall biosynthesis